MNALESFIETLGPGMWLSEAQAKRLVEIDRLHPVLVRCGSVRFTCGAQYLEAMLGYVTAGGDYVRDCSLPMGSRERAAEWKAEAPWKPMLPVAMQGANPLIASLSARLPLWTFQPYGTNGAVACFPRIVGPFAFAELSAVAPISSAGSVFYVVTGLRSPSPGLSRFNESDCGGAFDGNQVTSDADPGL